jgi:SP family facilitated glucose transporter-like MFS transporter 3
LAPLLLEINVAANLPNCSNFPFVSIALSRNVANHDRSSYGEERDANLGSGYQVDYSGGSSPTLSEHSVNFPKFLSSPSYTISLILAVFTSVLASFQVGYNSGVLNVPEAVIRSALELAEVEWSIIVAIFAIGGLLGSIFGARTADSLGRKNFLVANNVLFIAGGLCQALSVNFGLMALGRLLIGIGCGGVTVVVPLYLGEISPAHLRGSLGTMNQFSMVIGILIANILGKPLGGEQEWRYLLGLVLIPALLQIILSPVLLESPLWLVLQHTNKSLMMAEEALCKLRGTEDVDFELECMLANKEEDRRHKSSGDSMIKTLFNPIYRLPLTVGLVLQLAQQFSGINAVFYYSTGFFAKAHVSDPWLGSVLAASINMLATALAIPAMDRIGRRVLLILSSAGMMLSCVGLTISLYYMEFQPGYQDSVLFSTLAVFGVLMFVTFFEFGLGPIPWLIGAEIFPSKIRSSGMAAASIVNWSANFCVGLSFPHINNFLGVYTFLPFGAVLVLVIVFIVAVVPETRGKSLEEIQEEIMGGMADVEISPLIGKGQKKGGNNNKNSYGSEQPNEQEEFLEADESYDGLNPNSTQESSYLDAHYSDIDSVSQI